MKCRGVSPVIATVLLLVITVSLISVLAAFTIPFIKNSLEPGEDCFKALNKLNLGGTPYTCYSNGTTLRTGISVQVGDIDIQGFKLILYSGGTADPINILPDTSSAQVRMLGSDFNTPLQIPAKGGLKTYVVSGTYTKVEVAPILASGTCEKSDTFEIVQCRDAIINANLTQY